MFGSKDIATIEGQASTGFLRTSELVVRVQSKNPWELCYQGFLGWRRWESNLDPLLAKQVL